MSQIPASSPIDRIMEHRWSFAAAFFIVFTLTYVTLLVAGLVPSALKPEPYEARPILTAPSAHSFEAQPHAPLEEGELPVRVEIPSIGVAATVSNPNTTSISALDRALLTGAVRYPGTGKLGEEGNVLIFGHSSYLPVVHNQAYKAFNGIQNLTRGDFITVHGTDRSYVYAVETVEESDTQTGEIARDVIGAKLTLATCDTFGAKEDRWIVTAVLVDIYEK